MTDETTSEQLAEIDRDMADIERQVAELVEEAQKADYKTQELPDKTQELETKTQELPEYTPPEGWRVLQVGEALREGDVIVHKHDAMYATARAGGWVGANQRYIRPIEPEPQPEPQPIQVREGRWRTRGGSIRNVTPTPQDHESFPAAYLWWDGFDTWRNDGRWWAAQETTSDLVEYLGPIEPDKTQELPEYTPPEGWRVLAVGEVLQPGDHWVNWEGTVSRPDIQHGDGATVSGGRYIRWVKPQPQPEPQPNAAAIEELRSEVSYVQNLLGTERRKVTELEELVTSLRTINRGCENAVRDAGKENTALRNQLAAVKAELASVAADRQQLRVELDAAQQVPADSPELRQLRADLAEVTQDRDTYRHAHELLLNDVNATHARTKAMTVEAIAEWLQAFRGCNSPALALLLLEALPSIMRSLTGLADDEDVD